MPGPARAVLVAVLSAAAVALGAHATALAGAGPVGPAPDEPAPQAAQRPQRPGQLLVTTGAGEGLDAGAVTALGLPGVTSVVELSSSVLRVSVAPALADAAAATLGELAGVVAVEPNRVSEYHAVPDDPLFAQQWAHRLSGAEAAWDVTTGDGTVIAVLDSGVDGAHADLAGTVVQQLDASTGVVTQGAAPVNDACGLGHGTLVAGIAGAGGNNTAGVAGVAWRPQILDIALSAPSLGCRGPDDAATIAALHYVARQAAPRPDVVNMSFGGPAEGGCPAGVQAAIDEAVAAGITLFASAGNGEDNTLAGVPQVPASCDGVISVGGAGPDGEAASYSTTNPFVDLLAPGGDRRDLGGLGDVTTVEVLSTCLLDGRTVRGCGADDYGSVQGTSFASPYAAAAGALVRAANPALTPDQVRSVLEGTAEDRGVPGRDDISGWGLLRVDRAVAAAASGAVPAVAPDPSLAPSAPVATRIAAGGGATEAVGQAVAVSQALFDAGGAAWAVLARTDDFADALAGSGLGYGVAPVLFTPPAGTLAPATAAELRRVLAPGSAVFLMGGPAALPQTLEGELTALGYRPIRFAGEAREETAAMAARQIAEQSGAGGLPALDAVIVATRSNWPDSVAAGQLAARFGLPVLLTATDRLHPATQAAVQTLAPSTVYVVGGAAAVSDAVLGQLAAVTGRQPVRLGGPSRIETALQVADELRAQARTAPGLGEITRTAAVNLRRDDGFAHVLSATVLAGSGVAFAPLEGVDGSLVTPAVSAAVCDLGGDLLLAGGADLVSDAAAARLADNLEGFGC